MGVITGQMQQQLLGALVVGADRSADLATWAVDPGLDAVIASAIRSADQTRRDYKEFVAASRNGLLRHLRP